MSRAILAVGAVALLATGVAVGFVAGASDDESPAPSPGVVVRGRDGAPTTLTVAEAAARLERLEAQVARAARPRAAVTESDEEDDDTIRAPAPDRTLPDVPVPRKPDGSSYSAAELRELAKTSPDRALRLAAIRALRRDDTPEARAALSEVVTDKETPADLRVEAAKALAKPPHRDQTPEELVKLLAATDLPADVRLELADGVTRLKDRGAWMSEISAQMAREADASVRALLFDTVQRSASDPAAKAELVALLANSAARPDEARLAAQALARLGNDRKALEALGPYLASGDSALREQAVAAWAKAGRLTQEQLSATLGDATPAVRAAVFAASVPQLPKNATKEQKAERDDLLRRAAETALADSEADVRRAALAWAGAMPQDLRDKVLEKARADSDPLVSIEAYARSPAAVVKAQPDTILSRLDASDPKVRDAAFRLVVKTWGVDVPYRAGWNAAARARAVAEIRAQVATR